MQLSDSIRAMESFLRAREDHYIGLLRHMVSVNSYTLNHPGVHALGELTAPPFEDLGFVAERVPAEDPQFGEHLFLTRATEAGPEAPSVALVSHLDTVFSPEEELQNDFSWRETEDRLYGPGSVDAKGGTVVALMVLDALAELAPEILGSVHWIVALNAAEERMALDFGRLCRERMAPHPPAACLVFEGGRLRDGECPLVVRRKGMAVFEVSVEGRSAHAGSRHPRGANAVVQLARVLVEIDSWTDYERELTFNVGPVEGGTVVNRVPSSASARIEMRTFDPEVFNEALDRMQALDGFSSVASPEDGYPCRVRVEQLLEVDPWPPGPQTERLLAIWGESASSLGLQAVPEHRGGLSDANHLWESAPTLDGLGPDGAWAHCSERSDDGTKDQEHAFRSSFVPKALVSLGGLLRLLDG